MAQDLSPSPPAAAALTLALALAAIRLVVRSANQVAYLLSAGGGHASGRAEILTERWRLWHRAARVLALVASLLLRYALCRVRWRRLSRLGGGAEASAAIERLWAGTNEAAGALLASELVGLGGLWIVHIFVVLTLKVQRLIPYSSTML